MGAEVLAQLVVAVPAAVAVIVVVSMFLRFLREERTVRAEDQRAVLAVLERLRDGMEELAREIRQTIGRG